MSFQTNPNRLIKIYKTGNDEKTGSWRDNLSRIAGTIEQYHDNKAEFITGVKDFATNFNVDPGIELLMDAELPKFKTTNDFKAPLESWINEIGNVANKINGVLTLLDGFKSFVKGNWTDSTGVTAATFMPWVKNIKAWDGSTALGISPTFKFAMGQYGLWNAREEVVKPILNLIAPTIPQYLNAWSMSGPAPNSFNLITEMIQSVARTIAEEGEDADWQRVRNSWNSLSSDWTFDLSDPTALMDKISTKIGEVGDVLGSLLEYLVLGSFKRYTYTIEFGNMFRMNRMLIVDSDWSFSKEVDQYGLPVTGQVTLKMESTIPMAMASSSDANMFMRYKFGTNEGQTSEQV